MLRHLRLISSFAIFSLSVKAESLHQLDISMPYSKPELPETYLCTTLKLTQNDTNYAIAFEPRADPKIAHHMILYGCTKPGDQFNEVTKNNTYHFKLSHDHFRSLIAGKWKGRIQDGKNPNSLALFLGELFDFIGFVLRKFIWG